MMHNAAKHVVSIKRKIDRLHHVARYFEVPDSAFDKITTKRRDARRLLRWRGY